MGLDRQNIERRDFPIGRRGYDPAAVDAHLQELASEVEELRRSASDRGADSLAASTGAQVQSIVAAAESGAAEIESQARASAESMREQAESAAAKARADAVEQAEAQVTAVSRACAALLARVEAMDGQVDVLVQSLRTGATELASDLQAVQTNMAELYDAASGRRLRSAEEPVDGAASGASASKDSGGRDALDSPARFVPSTASAGAVTPTASGAPTASGPRSAAPPSSASPAPASSEAPAPSEAPASLGAPVASNMPTSPANDEQAPASTAPAGAALTASGRAPTPGSAGLADAGPNEPVVHPTDAQAADTDDYDARLAALNMALNGDTREATDRYIAEHYKVADRQKLLDEVFAAIES